MRSLLPKLIVHKTHDVDKTNDVILEIQEHIENGHLIESKVYKIR